jgi:long-chain acyl-CoA synthetase
MAFVTLSAKIAERDSPTVPSELPVYLDRIAHLDSEFILFDDGYRGWTYSYQEMAGMAASFAARLRAEGIRKGETVMIWSESRPGWIAALWGCLLEGVVVVPVEQRSSLDLFQRIKEKVRPRALLLGNRVPAVADGGCSVIWWMSELEQAEPRPLPAGCPAFSSDDVAEIVFTSGTTAEPKGVVITHGNLAASLKPVEEQIAPYLRYVRPFAPLRFLNLLPMSHLFGQALALFLPPLIPASIVFISSLSAQEIVRQIRTRRVAVLVAVPKILEVLRDFIVHRFSEASDSSRASDPWPLRWWRFRSVHRLFGLRFCCFFVGGAPLPPDLEQFWANLGFVVAQGYGLTETAPIVSFSHPFHVRPGTTGKPLVGLDVQIAEDGEVLVRGDNVTPGYFQAPEETAAAFRDGWFHTGDVGEFDAEGNLVIRGRKKEMIATPEGFKVFPEDVEGVLNRIPGVRDSAVIGKDSVHAVLVLETGANADEIVRAANKRLEPHQRIRSVSIWTDGDLPRTATTRKLRHAEIAERVRKGAIRAPAGRAAELTDLVRKFAPGRVIEPETTLDELGLSSLDRVQLMMDLEEKLETSVDESVFASVSKVGDLAAPMVPKEQTHFPRYNRTAVARVIRRVALASVLLPLTRFLARMKVSGLENLDNIRGPVIFASNHQSYMDPAVVLASLPGRWRYHIAPVMWKEFFDAHFCPERHSLRERLTNSTLYWLVTLLGNSFPIPQSETGVRESIRYMGELVEEGWSILIFPEGERSLTGEVGRFLPGVGLIASRLQLPIVPIRLRGLDRVWHPTAKLPRPGPVEVTIGAPLWLKGESYAALAQKLEQVIRRLR